MHPLNPHNDKYDLKTLSSAHLELTSFVSINQHGIETIDFSNPKAVKALNQAILKYFYGIKYWDFPSNFLCPPIPGRAEYIHQISDLFENKNGLTVLDVGVGANCIYPLIGSKSYDWNFIGSDTNVLALQSAQKIVDKNDLKNKIELRHQKSNRKFFQNIIQKNEKVDLTICNPPFHESQNQASSGTMRKWRNLGKKKLSPILNFGGQASELWCPGGELAFIQGMIYESLEYNSQVGWFSSLVSKRENLDKLLKKSKQLPIETRILEMELGNKKSRILAWRIKG